MGKAKIYLLSRSHGQREPLTIHYTIASTTPYQRFSNSITGSTTAQEQKGGGWGNEEHENEHNKRREKWKYMTVAYKDTRVCI